jgi:tRNA modification GTPase
MVRLSGRACHAILGALLDGYAPATPGSRAITARLHLGPSSLPLLVLRHFAPRSYTGEDSAELILPGNPHLVARVLEVLTRQAGVRPAEPGEFTARAFLSGRMTLEQAEGVAARVAAESRADLDASRDLLDGTLGARYRAWGAACTDLLALVEAGIDFTDQEGVVAITPADLSRQVGEITGAVRAALGGIEVRAEPRPPLVVLAGHPNAGKSALFNALLGASRVIASPVAGTTRDAIIEPLVLDAALPGAGGVLLADLPGLDASPSGPAGLAAQAQARAVIDRADLLVWCDPTARFDDPALSHAARGRALVRVRTFADRPGPSVSDAIPVCALDGWNLAALRHAIASAATGARQASAAALLPRHRRALTNAAAALERTRGTCGSGPMLPAPEITAHALREALDALGELVGRIEPDQVLGRVFATFCIGK